MMMCGCFCLLADSKLTWLVWFAIAVDVFTVPGFNNTAPVLLNFTSATPCWFMIRTGPDRVEDAKNSAHFNVIGVENKAGRRIWELESDPAESPSGSMTNPPASPTSATPTQQPSRRPSGDDDAGDNNRGRSSSGGGTESTERSENPAPPGDDEGPGGLSAGASAGIGIGTAVGLIAVAGGAFWIWWRRRQRQIGTVAAATAAAATTTTTTTTTTTNTRLDGGGGDLPAETASAPFPKRAELSSVNGPAEMEVSERAVRHELAA